MSGSIGLSSAPFTDAEKADVRRFCGYPSYGGGNSGFQGWRFFQAYGLMEYRMNNMAPAEIQVTRQYLTFLYPLEAALPAMTNIEVDTAGPFKRNRNEQRDRDMLFDSTRRRFVGFIGVPAGPNLGQGGMTIIV